MIQTPLKKIVLVQVSRQVTPKREFNTGQAKKQLKYRSMLLKVLVAVEMMVLAKFYLQMLWKNILKGSRWGLHQQIQIKE